MKKRSTLTLEERERLLMLAYERLAEANITLMNIASELEERMGTLKYSKKYDAYYNPFTYEWAEKKCSDPKCEYCADRPETAIGVKEEQKESRHERS